jgi:hypothetical protein
VVIRNVKEGESQILPTENLQLKIDPGAFGSQKTELDSLVKPENDILGTK